MKFKDELDKLNEERSVERSFNENETIMTKEMQKMLKMSPEAALKFKMTSPRQSNYANPQQGVLSAFHQNSNSNDHRRRIQNLSQGVDAKSKALEEKLLKITPNKKNWDHPLYDDSKGGMSRSPSNGILSLFDQDSKRVMGAKYHARQTEIANMQFRNNRMSQENHEK